MKSTQTTALAETLPPCAVVGCGAAAMEFVLPVLRKYANAVQSVVLVDCNTRQARQVADKFGLQHVASDITSLPFDVDAALVTTPHKFHASQAIHFLNQRKHVFVEKPLSMTADEATRVVQAANANGCVCMVNNYRRLFPSYQKVRELLRSGEVGPVRRITIYDGTQFAWPSASAFYLRDPQARGVLLDRGAHTIDAVCWWLGETPCVVAALSDAFDGVEGLADVRLSGTTAAVQIKFSRFHRLANSYTIDGDAGRVAGRLFDFGRLQWQRNGRKEWIDAGRPRPHYEYAWQLVENFFQAVRGQAAPLFTAQDVAPSIAVIDDAYRQTTPYSAPWYTDDANIARLKSEWGTRRGSSL
jgi:predicted dehydrogenase